VRQPSSGSPSCSTGSVQWTPPSCSSQLSRLAGFHGSRKERRMMPAWCPTLPQIRENRCKVVGSRRLRRRCRREAEAALPSGKPMPGGRRTGRRSMSGRPSCSTGSVQWTRPNYSIRPCRLARFHGSRKERRMIPAWCPPLPQIRGKNRCTGVGSRRSRRRCRREWATG